jgi:hypothetical protein
MQIGGFLTVTSVVTLLVGLRAAERARKYRIARRAAALSRTNTNEPGPGPDARGPRLMGRTA